MLSRIDSRLDPQTEPTWTGLAIDAAARIADGESTFDEEADGFALRYGERDVGDFIDEVEMIMEDAA